MEIMLADSILESSDAWRFAKESATATDGVGNGEWLTTMVVDAIEMPGSMARAAKSLEAGAGAASAMPEPEAQRPVASEEQAAHPEMS